MSFARAWLPNQHGAWAMLITPVLVGALLTNVRAIHPVLLLTWLAAYCTNFFFMLAVKSRRWARYRTQLGVYGTVTAIGGFVVLLVQPRLILLSGAAIPVFLINLYFVRTRNERAWLNDVSGILLAGVVGFAAFRLGYVGENASVINAAWRAIAIVCVYFIGTVFYVKTIIRERGSQRWLRMSIAFHALFAVALTAMGWWFVAAVASLALVRAVVIPSRAWTPKRVGLLEIAFTVLFGIGALRLG